MDSKEAYQEQAQARLKELKARIDLLEAQAGVAEAEANVEYTQQIEELRRRQTEMEQRLENVQVASSEAWKELATGVDKALDSLGNSVSNAIARFSEHLDS